MMMSWRTSETKKWIRVSDINLLPRATALHNVELPLIYNGSSLGRAAGTRRGAGARGLGRSDESQAHELSGGPRQRVATRGRW